MTKRPSEEITDHEDPDPVQPTVLAYHALPYPFGDQTAQSLFMWCVEQVLQHPETPLTDKTRQFIKDLYGDILTAGSEAPEPRIKVVK